MVKFVSYLLPKVGGGFTGLEIICDMVKFVSHLPKVGGFFRLVTLASSITINHRYDIAEILRERR